MIYGNILEITEKKCVKRYFHLKGKILLILPENLEMVQDRMYVCIIH